MEIRIIFFHVTEGTRVVHVRTCRHLQLQQPGIFPTAGQEERLPWVQVIRFEARMRAFAVNYRTEFFRSSRSLAHNISVTFFSSTVHLSVGQLFHGKFNLTG